MLHGRIGREHHELVHLEDLVHQRRRRHAVTHPPTGHVKGFAKGADDHTATGQLRMGRHPMMALTIKHHVLVHLIGEHDDIGIAQQTGQGCQIVPAQHLAASYNFV